jgi:ABC-type uncharacterized transport system permease subunit
MFPVATGVFAGLCYTVATVMQVQIILKGSGLQAWVRGLGGLAVLAHALAVFQDFTGTEGIDLGIYPMLSLMALTIAAIVLLNSFRRPVDNLFILIFPIALLTVTMQLLFPGDYTPRGEMTNGILMHVVLSIAAYSLLTIAATQAVLLSFGDNRLRHHQLAVLRNLPPLQTMEQLMFEMLWTGLMFLTLSIATGFIFLDDISGPGLLHHTAITLLAWVVFAVLLWGRYQLGWRGAIASRWTLAGFILLALGYFGSKVVLEVILGRA